MPRCPICGEPLKQRQKYCCTACRVIAYKLREAARIADDVREKTYKVLCEAILK
jgi:predicted nucleic acid-binding Zn ribbon protein